MKHIRIWEIDFLRGIAILLMVVFHTIVDLTDFYQYPFQYVSGFWYLEGKASAVLFMFLAGVSTTLSSDSFRHGLRILGWGMLLSVITYFYDANTYIRFGILHFLGVSLLSSRYVKRLTPALLILISLCSIGLGVSASGYYLNSSYLLPFGWITRDFVSMDYYPLFPWYGVFVIGVAAGKLLYKEKRSLFSFAWNSPVSLLGRHSLLIYLIHQPILLALLYWFHHSSYK